MNILLINKFYYLRGGSERQVFDMTELFEQKGHKVVPFSMQDSRNEKSDYEKYFVENINLHKAKLQNIIKYFYNYDAVRRLKKLLANEKIEIAHLHNIIGQISPAVIKVLKDRQIPIVMTLHDYRLLCPNGQMFTKGKMCDSCLGKNYYHCFTKKCMHNSYAKSLLGSLEAYLNDRISDLYSQVDLFIAPSEYMRQMAEKFGIPSEKIKVIYNFLDLKNEKFSNTEKSDDYLLYFGRLSGEKGLNILLDAFLSLSEPRKLKIAGEGPGALKLQAKIKKMNLEDRIVLVGYKKGQALTELIQKSKAVLLPSLWPENMPYSLLEAMANQKVVIASNIGGMTELIRDAENGFLFEAGDSKSLAQKIENMDSFDLDLLGKMARETIVKLNSENFYNELISNYKNLLKNR